ncbi:MAG: hypothetical protein WC372_11490 [Candidatus Neomarinimicrobiota bacterium]|jgi:hypothetical protein
MATAAELLTEVETAISRLITGGQMVTVNGQQFSFTHLRELRAWRAELKIEVAEAAGTDGRGAWEVAFDDN